MIREMRSEFTLFVISVAAASLPVFGQAARSAERAQWEYRVLSREQIAKLGKNDMAAGLNSLGAEGWQLVTVEPAFAPETNSKEPARTAQFYLMRPKQAPAPPPPVTAPAATKDQLVAQRADAQKRVVLAKADLEMWEERVPWSVRMAKKGYVTQAQVQADTAQLMRAKATLETAERELDSLPPLPEQSPRKERK